MEKYLLLEARKVNWGLSSCGDWSSISWKVYNDGTYFVEICFIPKQDPDDFIQKSGKMRKDHFTKLCEAMDRDWSSEFTTCACDGEAWEIKQYSPEGYIIKSNGTLDYIYGQKPLERITELLPGKTFIRNNPKKIRTEKYSC